MVESILQHKVFMRNCKQQRRNGAKICNDCPFRRFIERAEKEQKK